MIRQSKENNVDLEEGVHHLKAEILKGKIDRMSTTMTADTNIDVEDDFITYT